MAQCMMCNKEFDETIEGTYLGHYDEQYACEDCLEEYFYQCDECGGYYLETDMARLDGDHKLCIHCKDTYDTRRGIEREYNLYNDIDED